MSVRVGVFGWGIVAPKSPNIESFRNNLAAGGNWLSPFNGFGPDNFLVGTPEFDFEEYKAWIDKRFAPRHFQKLKEKMDDTSPVCDWRLHSGAAAEPGHGRRTEDP